jgi:hypothetical protein
MTTRAPRIHERTRLSQLLGSGASTFGAVVFFIGTTLHPPRDGEGIAAVADLYGLTHSIQAIGLMFLCLGLANLLAEATRHASRLIASLNAALLGTLTWLGLIVYDGAHNPVTAQHAPELVHMPGNLDIGAALIALPALLLFPLGHAALGWKLRREGLRGAGLLIAAGAVTYTIGGTLIFLLGPHSTLIQPIEIAGSLALALGFVASRRLFLEDAGRV